MKTLILILLLVLPLTGGDDKTIAQNYQVIEVPCYPVALCGIADSNGKLVTAPYGQGAWNDLKSMIAVWRDRGFDENDEQVLSQYLRSRSRWEWIKSGGKVGKHGAIVIEPNRGLTVREGDRATFRSRPPAVNGLAR